MFRGAIGLTLLLVFGGGLLPKAESLNQEPPARATEEKSCREHPQVIDRCFTVRGRLSIFSGAPARRIWRIGTRRMLGISEQRFAMAGYRNVPADIERQLDQDVAIVGDFLVCPFTRSRPGEMQLVCIENGKNLAVRKHRRHKSSVNSFVLFVLLCGAQTFEALWRNEWKEENR